MLQVSGTREMIAAMKKDVAKMKRGVQESHQKLVKAMFMDLVAHTPQWSGTLAMHWGIEVHGAKAPAAYTVHNPAWEKYDKGLPQLQQPFQMGAEPAVTITVARELQKIQQIKYNSKVKFVNNMPYAEAVERGQGPGKTVIRDVNRLASFGGVAMVQYLEMKYSNKQNIKRAIR